MPDDTGIEAVVEDEGDGLTEQDRCDLHDALSESWASVLAGHLRPATEILDELRVRRSR